MANNNDSAVSHPASGIVADGLPSRDDCNLAMLAHFLVIVTGFIGPLLIWLFKRDEGGYLERQAREALNFGITLSLFGLLAFLLSFLIIGFFLYPILFLMGLILPVIAAVKTAKGEDFHYPIAIRLVQ